MSASPNDDPSPDPDWAPWELDPWTPWSWRDFARGTAPVLAEDPEV